MVERVLSKQSDTFGLVFLESSLLTRSNREMEVNGGYRSRK